MYQNLYLDTETCGLTGPVVLMQYAIEDGPIILHEVWRNPVSTTLDLIKDICRYRVVGFNLTFDWFHVQKLYNLFDLYLSRFGDEVPSIAKAASIEAEARDGLCVKPASAMDLMLWFRRTELQIVMERDDIRIRRVPTILAQSVADELTRRLQLDPILFANYKKESPVFKVRELDENPKLCNIVLKFRPGSSLKILAKHILGADKILKHSDIALEKQFYPGELGYAPFADAFLENWKRKKYKWHKLIHHHINHWAFNDLARRYGEDDVKHTRDLHRHVGVQNGDDTDSILACAIGSARWKGYAVDTVKLQTLVEKYVAKARIPTAANRVKERLTELVNPIENAIWQKSGGSTGKKILEALKEFASPAVASYLTQVIEARGAEKKIDVLKKLLRAGRFHASFKVLGALSGRMSGADGLNPQGIDRTDEVRSCFPLAFPDEELAGGDMKAFEITIADADYKDPKLRQQLMICEKCGMTMLIKDSRLTCPACGCFDAKSFHGLFGLAFYTTMTYHELKATKGKEDDIYTKCKTAAFATLYGAQPPKTQATLGITLEEAEEGYHRFWRTYQEAGHARKKIENDFATLVSDERGRITIQEAKRDNIESLLGFKRWFQLETSILVELAKLAESPPREWHVIKDKITRSRKGEQSVVGAIRSALYGSAFAMQNAMIRQAANHRIQSTGAYITKEIQRAIWDIQPSGVSEWLVRPLNVHDELQVPCKPGLVPRITEVVKNKVEEYRKVVPLIGVDFGQLTNWSDK